MRGLEVLGEVGALIETVGGGGRIHKEVWRSVELDDDAASARVALVVIEENVFDVRKGVLNLVSRLLIVDVVGHCTLVRRIENNQIHGILCNTRPLANAERSAGQVMDH